ncbi:MAG: hypothetical protein CVV51_00850 [Spirochaetae bacterium HGW-Spirochaetae-7]|nr:MAG: hypothetical protein CVV51_00850 [Spirochaetae bacterium HGW-Spirochaetae-7]
MQSRCSPPPTKRCSRPRNPAEIAWPRSRRFPRPRLSSASLRQYIPLMSEYSIRVAGSISNVDRASWNSCPAAACPFLSWEFFASLEASGAVSEAAGWIPAHAELSRDGKVEAYLPLFVLLGSAGSFVWDDGMEAAARSVRLRWYPKLAGAVPFTPAPVWRPLVLPGVDERPVFAASAEAVATLARDGGFSGAHFHWVDPVFAQAMVAFGGREEAGKHGLWLEWKRQAYRWTNSGYGTFDDFTGSFSKNMRRNVARDRADVERAGIAVRMVRGDEAGHRMWRLMADWDERTNDKFGPWAARFLPPRFFELAPEYLGSAVRFSAAYERGSADPLALAMLFRGPDTIWGRYWGSARDLPGLHFETCYYAPIDYAIREGLAGFDPGMGSHHKARRGFRSILASSFHRVFDRRLARPFADALAEASAGEVAFARELDADLPFRRDPPVGRASIGSGPHDPRRTS